MSLTEKVVCTVDAETERIVRQLDEIREKGDIQCQVAAETNEAMCTEPLPQFQYGQAHICFAGSTNAGKSSLLNGILCGNSDAPLCPTNIKAETVHNTEFHFGSGFSIEDEQSETLGKQNFFDKLRSLQKRVMGAEVECSEVKNIKVTMPPSPCFDPKSLAVLVDTPGVTEDPMMAEAVLNRLKTCPPGHFPLLVYCYSLASGISTRPGMELSTQDKMFIEAADIPAHRTILIATQYDRFVGGQKDESGDFNSVNESDDFWDFTDVGLSDEEKQSQAEESFTVWREKVKARYPGITVLPFARVGPAHGGGDATPVKLRSKMLSDIRETLAERVQVVHRDMLLRYKSNMQQILSSRLTNAIVVSHPAADPLRWFPCLGTSPLQLPTDRHGAREQAAQFDPTITEAMEESQLILDSLLPEVREIIQRAQTKLSSEGYARAKSFRNDLLDQVHDPITSLIKKSFRTAHSKAYQKLLSVLNVSASLSPQDNPSLARGNQSTGDWFDVACVLCPAGGAVAGGVALLIEGSMVARGLVALGAGSGVGLVLFATTALVASAAWTYDGVVEDIHRMYENAIHDKTALFTAGLKQSLQQHTLNAINQFNHDMGDATAMAIAPVQAMLNDKDLHNSLHSHMVKMCCICYEKPCNTQLKPCGHDGFCNNCVSEYLAHCPMCRQPIEEREQQVSSSSSSSQA